MPSHPFEYRKPTYTEVDRMQEINALLKAAYDKMIELVPANRGRSLAITNLQQSRMWINAAILEIEA